MKNELNYTSEISLWQVMEGRKRRYQALEQHNFDANVDYDSIFEQIDKELDDASTSRN